MCAREMFYINVGTSVTPLPSPPLPNAYSQFPSFLVNKANLGAQLIVSIFINLYIFLPTMGPKHIQIDKYTKNKYTEDKLCTKLALFTRLYRDARSIKLKIL